MSADDPAMLVLAAPLAREALAETLSFLKELAEPSLTYGLFPGGDTDPRTFVQDEESCTPEEIAAYKAACAAWERGERPEVKHPMDGTLSAIVVGGEVVGAQKSACNSPLGIGSYEYRDPDIERLVAKVEAALRALGVVPEK